MKYTSDNCSPTPSVSRMRRTPLWSRRVPLFFVWSLRRPFRGVVCHGGMIPQVVFEVMWAPWRIVILLAMLVYRKRWCSQFVYEIVSNPMINFFAFSVTLRSRHLWNTIRVLSLKYSSFDPSRQCTPHICYVYAHAFLEKVSWRLKAHRYLGPFVYTPKCDECRVLTARLI